MPFGPVTLIFYWPQKKISGQPKAALISGTVFYTYVMIFELYSEYFWVNTDGFCCIYFILCFVQVFKHAFYLC